MPSKEYNYNRFLKNTQRLASDCCTARKRFSLASRTFTESISDLNQLASSLDQRITQDRALLVKQADEIYKLRQSNTDNQWNKWAQNIYYLLAGEYFVGDDNYVLRDMIDDIIDENASIIALKRNADKRRSMELTCGSSSSPPELTPSPKRDYNRTPSLYSSPLQD